MHDYLLSETHVDGQHKAALFKDSGFTATMREELEAELLRLAMEADVVKIEDVPWGTKYIVHGDIVAPDGRRTLAMAVWIIDEGNDAPRLVTARPLEKSR